jgi:hypothetical protein
LALEDSIMGLRNIRVVYPCRNTPGLPGSPEYVRWLDGIGRAFAGQGWRVTSLGPATNSDEDAFCLESDGGPIPRSALEAALREGGIEPLYWHGDVDESA